MTIATAAMSAMLAALILYAAARKLSHKPEVVAEYAKVGVAEERLNFLAVLLISAAVALLAGLAWAPLGIAAGLALVGYFAVAIAAHLRFDDREALTPPIALELFALCVVVLHAASL